MSLLSDTGRELRPTRLFGPIVGVAVVALVLMILTSMILIQRFDASASDREQHVVETGFSRNVREFNEVVATQVNWDDAIKALDHGVDADWADLNLGNYLYTFNGISHVFVVDGEARPIYAAVRGERADLGNYARFAPSVARLLPAIRKAEQARGPVKERPGKNNIKVPAIETNSVEMVGNQPYLLTASLVQPDFGKVRPKGPRAPVVIAVRPIDGAWVSEFGEHHLLDGLRFEAGSAPGVGNGRLELRDGKARPVGALIWDPREPGTQVLDQIKVPLFLGFGLFGLLCWMIFRNGAVVVNELIASEARSKHLAYHDPLTRLPNRTMLFERLHLLLAGVQPGERAVSVLCVDLDRFKEVNDTLGHQAGDILIEMIATRLRGICSDAALIARLGGDEFVVLYEIGDRHEIAAMAGQIIAVTATPVQSEYGEIEVGCSIGIAIIDGPGVEPSEALRWADVALYKSKENGRQQATFFEPEMDVVLRNRRSLEADLRLALNDGSLRMVYQPQVDLAGRITGVEALLRWHHPVRGSVPPGVFVPLAEETGQILAIGEHVLRTVFAETAGWVDHRVAVNVSAVQMRSPGFAALVMRLAASAGIDPTRYEIELTETALLSDEPTIAANIEILRRLGMTIALDDFGTGYSSLSVLQRFSVDKIKIDRSFVNCIEDGGESEALIDAMIKLAKALDLHVIAEGVETAAQRQRLAGCGCSNFQGHLLGMPLPAEDIAELLGVKEMPMRRALNFG